MAFIRSGRTPAGARTWLAALVAALVIVLAAVAPVLAARGPSRLSDPSVSPTSGPAGTSVTFEVTYGNGTGNAAASIVVRLGTASYPMAPVDGQASSGAGTRYRAVVTPAVGAWQVTFISTDKFGYEVALAAGTVTISPPPPPPAPSNGGTGGASGGSTSGGSTSGGSTSGGSGTSPGSTGGTSASPPTTASGSTTTTGGSTGPSTSAGPTGTGTSATGPSGTPTAAADGSGSSPGSSTGQLDVPPRPAPWSGSAAGTISAAPSRTAPGAGPDAGGLAPAAVAERWLGSSNASGVGTSPIATAGTGTGGSGPSRRPTGSTGSGVPNAGPLPGLPGGPSPLDTYLPTLISTFGGLAMVMSFMLFGKRRRGDPTDTDEHLAEAAATGAEAVAPGSLLGRRAEALTPRPADPVDQEALMPRWRRPSLLAARKEDPLRTERAEFHLTFEQGAVDPVAGRERRRIRYRVVRLLDSPDEFTGSEIGMLDAGDEVQLIERSGVYWFVLCPDGRQGWVHKMVLGEAVTDDDLPGPAARAIGARGRGPMPPADDADREDGRPAWSIRDRSSMDAGSGIDDDVLRAYLAARAQG